MWWKILQLHSTYKNKRNTRDEYIIDNPIWQQTPLKLCFFLYLKLLRFLYYFVLLSTELMDILGGLIDSSLPPLPTFVSQVFPKKLFESFRMNTWVPTHSWLYIDLPLREGMGAVRNVIKDVENRNGDWNKSNLQIHE